MSGEALQSLFDLNLHFGVKSALGVCEPISARDLRKEKVVFFRDFLLRFF